MKKMMQILMLSCEKATLYIEKSAVKELPPLQNIRLKMHTAFCDACKQYQRQSVLINHAIQKHLSDISTSKNPTEPSMGYQAKQNIQQEIEKRLAQK
jgi:hypothetical protein